MDESGSTTQMRRGVVGPCVLALLRGGARYGLDIAQELQRTGLIASAGTIYPVLNRLEATGYVVGRWVVESEERPRRFYELTASGRAEVGAFRSEWATFALAVSTMLDGERIAND